MAPVSILETTPSTSIPSFSYVLRAIVVGIFAIAVVCALIFFVPRIFRGIFCSRPTVADISYTRKPHAIKTGHKVITPTNQLGSLRPLRQNPSWKTVETRPRSEKPSLIKDPVDSDPQSPDAQKWAHQLLTRFRNVDDYAVPMPNVVVSPTISSPSTPPSEQDFSLSTPKLSFQAPTSLDVSMLSQDTREVNITQAVAEYFFADSCVGSIPSDDPARPPSSETKLVPSIIVNEYMDISKPVPLVCKQVRDPWLRAYDNIHLAAPPMSWNAPRTRRNGATPLGFTNVSNANGSAFNMSRNRPSSCVSSVFKVNVAGPFSPQIKTISPAPYFWGMTASNQLFS